MISNELRCYDLAPAAGDLSPTEELLLDALEDEEAKVRRLRRALRAARAPVVVDCPCCNWFGGECSAAEWYTEGTA